jgi:hypothetical protein
MFPQLAVALLAASSVMSSPIAFRKNFARTDNTSPNIPPSLNKWNGISSLDNFDNFYGADNFDGHQNTQTIIVQEQQVVCHAQRIEIIQQKIVILQEMMKRVITEQVCEVETQTIIIQQINSGMGNFGRDVGHENSGRSAGYDKSIADKYKSLTNDDGSWNDNDYGFTGHDVGKSYVSPSGNNWNDQDGASRVKAAQQAAHQASSYGHASKSSSGSKSSSNSSSASHDSSSSVSHDSSSSSASHDLSSSASASTTASSEAQSSSEAKETASSTASASESAATESGEESESSSAASSSAESSTTTQAPYY